MIVEMLADTDKCEDAGILCLLQKEFRASQASFALSEPIKTFGADKRLAAPKPLPKPFKPCEKSHPSPKAQGDPRQAKGRREAPRGGKAPPRPDSNSRGRALPNLAGRGLGPAWLGPRADANGALNILRKAAPAFEANASLSPRFELRWLSPRGLRPFARAKARAIA